MIDSRNDLCFFEESFDVRLRKVGDTDLLFRKMEIREKHREREREREQAVVFDEYELGECSTSFATSSSSDGSKDAGINERSNDKLTALTFPVSNNFSISFHV